MTPQEIIEGNQLLAEFMGRKGKVNAHLYWVNVPSVKWVTIEQMQFHTSWDWLMPVVEKIEDTSFVFPYGHSFILDNWNVTIKDCYTGEIRVSINPSSHKIHSKIEAAWLACISFVKYCNQNKEK